MESRTEKIINTIAGLKIGDTVKVSIAGDEMHAGWEDRFRVCGVSENYVLVFQNY